MQPYTLPSKYTGEKITGLFFDFKNHLGTGETIQQAIVTSTPNLHSNVQWLGTVVSWDIDGGSVGDMIAITVKAIGTQGSIRFAYAKMPIVANPSL